MSRKEGWASCSLPPAGPEQGNSLLWGLGALGLLPMLGGRLWGQTPGAVCKSGPFPTAAASPRTFLNPEPAHSFSFPGTGRGHCQRYWGAAHGCPGSWGPTHSLLRLPRAPSGAGGTCPGQGDSLSCSCRVPRGREVPGSWALPPACGLPAAGSVGEGAEETVWGTPPLACSPSPGCPVDCSRFHRILKSGARAA